MLCTQILTADFCVKYILNLDIDDGSEDSYLFDKNYILKKQSHITEKDFDIAYNLYCKDLLNFPILDSETNHQ